MTRRRTQPSRSVERDLYLASRTLGDIRTVRRGGVTAYGVRLVRRSWRRQLGRRSRGWL